MKQKNQKFTDNKNRQKLTLQQMNAITGGQELTPDQQEENTGSAECYSISNVLKTKHDTAKNSVGNIR